ncbi:zf-RVT domain-containing protein, partial [Cephalotus follicularis]
VCKPKVEGGLGLRRVVDCNKAAVMRLTWNILTDRLSLWVRWCKDEILKGRSFWQIEWKQSLSVTWKHILKLHTPVSANLVYSIGCNSTWSLWHDPWFQNCPLFVRVGNRAIYNSGLPRDTTLSEVIQGARWNWPVQSSLCPFGCGQQESIDHLFFQCPFTKSIWRKVLHLNNCPFPAAWNWENIVIWALDHSIGNHFHLWMRRAGLAASVYHCWRERNNIIFRQYEASTSVLLARITSDVARKVAMCMSIIDTPTNRSIVDNWEIEESIFRPCSGYGAGLGGARFGNRRR